jgi:small Trp-rich protein
MWMVVVGTVLVALKFADIEPVAAWSWLGVLAPFGLAVAWWAYADATGMTQRREMDKVDRKRADRRRNAFEALGIDPQAQGRHEKAEAYRRSREQQGKQP